MILTSKTYLAKKYMGKRLVSLSDFLLDASFHGDTIKCVCHKETCHNGEDDICCSKL